MIQSAEALLFQAAKGVDSLHAWLPRVQCMEHGINAVAVPWARSGSGFSLLFEALIRYVCIKSIENLIAMIYLLVGKIDLQPILGRISK